MATDQSAATLRDRIQKVQAFDKPQLLKRPEWGNLSFEDAAPWVRAIFEVANNFAELPLEKLPEAIAQQLASKFEELFRVFNQVDTFSLALANPTQARGQYAAQFSPQYDDLVARWGIWIPFLAYQKGDVSSNIASLAENVRASAQILENARKESQEKAAELGTIILSAREASAAAGAAVFTFQFGEKASHLEQDARKWLWATAILAILTLAFAVFSYLLIDAAINNIALVQRVAGKAAIYGVLVTATIWCGRIYKALMHQSTMYRFKALGLQTFQAFVAGSPDAQTKSAVLLETTRSIFTTPQSGYIDDEGSHESPLVEILKSALPKGED